MRNLLNPRWLFVINTLPVALLLLLSVGQFNIISSLLTENSLHLWKAFGWSLAFVSILNAIYAVFLCIRKRPVSLIYGIVALLVYIPYLYLYAYHAERIIPSTIPSWMISDNIILYAGTFLMPTLIYSLFILVVHLTNEARPQKAWMNFLIAIAIPFIAYVFSQTILPLWESTFNGEYSFHILLVLIIAATLMFLFFLIRGTVVLVMKKSPVWLRYQYAWKIPIAILLPLFGLAVNNGLLFDTFGSGGGVFGDFHNSWFYILAALNGLLLCLPVFDHKLYRLSLFFGQSILFGFTLYFFLVFLPFLPLSVIAIVAIGTGFLMLTPLLLFVIHLNELSKNFAYLKTWIPSKWLILISILGFLVLPSVITGNYLHDRHVLHSALHYVYSPDYSQSYRINKSSLEKTLHTVRKNKDNRQILFETQIPYLSSYFNRIVLDNLSLSEDKINTLKNIFFGEMPENLSSEHIRNQEVKITGLSTTSTYNPEQQAWKTLIEFEITNHSDDSWFAEYATTFELPEGCWISDYYLYVGERKEPGILAEKKSAMWVFSNIRNENKDPGILYYLTGNRVAFRVFPFSKSEVRRTGIELLHKEPVGLSIDNLPVQLGEPGKPLSGDTETDRAVYVSSEQKQSLKKIQRKPYLHFLIDTSVGKGEHRKDFSERIKAVLDSGKIPAGQARISFVNTYINTTGMDNEWQHKYLSQTFEGGFYLDRAIRKALTESYRKDSYPVLVVVTDDIRNAVFHKDFRDLQFTFPEMEQFFLAEKDGRLRAHPLLSDPYRALPDTLTPDFGQYVLEYPLEGESSVYLADNGKADIVLKKERITTDKTNTEEKNWLSALDMQAQWRSQILHPETTDEQWTSLVRQSFTSGIMTPVTSFIVVENEAQKAALRQKQKEALAGKSMLDLGEDAQQMSEPGLGVFVLLLGLVWWLRGRQKPCL